MKKIIILIFLCSCFKVKAQNNAFNFYKSDTTGLSFRYSLIINNINLNDVNKIVFYKHMAGDAAALVIKEIQISKVGNYFMLKDNGRTSLIQHNFNTTFTIPKNEEPNIIKYSYKIFKNNSNQETINIVKPN